MSLTEQMTIWRIVFITAAAVAIAAVAYLATQSRLPARVRFDVKKEEVRGNSMEPVLKNGQTIAIDNRYYQKNEIKRNDIVTVKFSWREEPLVKFIRAVPGDTLALQEQSDGNFHVIVNNEPIKNSEAEPYALTYAKSRMINLYAKEYQEKNGGKIPDRLYLVLGNQTSGTQDSTQFGLVSRENIVGKVVSE